jgi:hypothetical protein
MVTMLKTACAVALALIATPALAQPMSSCAAGTVPSVVRINTIKPGQRAAYDQAVRDHIKWYRDHGYTDNDIMVMPVMETPDHGKTWTVSQTQALSIHRNDPGVPSGAYDAAWAAYVAEYRASSDIATQLLTCLPAK